MKKYRKGVGIFLLNKEKKLWVGQRIDKKNKFWQMPQGGIDYDETPIQAMRRELMEESGIKKNFEIIKETGCWLKYDLPKELVGVVWNGKYVGQKQKWFACRFFGDDQEIRLDSYTPEFGRWKWINPSDSINLVVPFKKKLYKKILEEFSFLYN